MRQFVRASLLLLVSSLAYGQDSTYDPTTFIYEANQPLYNLYDSSNDWSSVDWYNSDSTFQWTTSGDDQGTQVNLYFDWERWDQTFSTAWQSSNGCLSFTAVCNQYISDDDGYRENTLYPLWTDLIAAGSDSKMAYYGDSEKMIFGWYNMWEYYRDSSNSFEVILWADSSYEFRYGELDITNHNVWIGEEGNSQQTDGKTLNEYLYFNRSLVNYGFDQHLTNMGITLEGASLYSEANTYTYTPPDPCDTDPQYSPDCAGYVEPYNETEDLTGLLTGTDLVFGDEPSDFYGLGDTTDNINLGYDTGVNDGSAFDGSNEEIYVADETTDFTSYDSEPTTFADATFTDTAPVEETVFVEEPLYIAEDLSSQTTQNSDFSNPEPEIFEESVFDDTELVMDIIVEGNVTEELVDVVEEPVLLEEELADTTIERQETKGQQQIREALEIVSSLGVLGNNPAFSTPGSVDPVSIALSNVTAEQAKIDNLIADQISNELSEISEVNNIDNAIELYSGTSVTEDVNETVDENIVEDKPTMASTTETTLTDTDLSAEELFAVSSVLEDNSGDASASFEFDSSFDDSATQSDIITDPTLVSSFVVAEIENNVQQSTDEEVVDNIISESNTFGEASFDSQFDQLLATGATTIGEVVSGEQPDYTKYDVKPIPQDEQQTLAKAEKQLETLSDDDANGNLDRIVEEMQEAGGFNNNQTLAVLLMSRVNGWNLYNTRLTDRGGWYTPEDVYRGNRPQDNMQNLRLLLTDDRHRALVDLQYE